METAERSFPTMLTLACKDKVLVIHLSGTTSNRIGKESSRSVYANTSEVVCSNSSYSSTLFSGDRELVMEWMVNFFNEFYFGPDIIRYQRDQLGVGREYKICKDPHLTWTKD